MAATGESRLILGTAPIPHPHFVVHGPAIFAPRGASVPQIILVHATSVKPNRPYDKSCVLQQGDHPSIHHPSYIWYRYAKIEPEPFYDRMTVQNVWPVLSVCDAALLARLQRGLCLSLETPQEIKTFFGCP